MISRIARVGRVARAGGGAAAFSSDQLSSLRVLYTSGPTWEFTDAPPGTIPVGDTDLVRTWRDRTANAFNITQATAGNRPAANLTASTWRTTGNGTSSQLDNVGAVSFSNATGLSMAMAFLPTTSTGAARYIVRLRDSATGDLMSLLKNGGDKFTGEYRTSTGTKNVASAASITTATPCVAIWSVDSSISYLHRLNGVEQTGTLAGAFAAITADTINVFSNGSQYWDGSIFEIIIRTAPMTPTDITNIETYFRNTYGTP